MKTKKVRKPNFYVLDDKGYAQKAGPWVIVYDSKGKKVGARKSFSAAGLLIGWKMPQTDFTLNQVDSLPVV